MVPVFRGLLPVVCLMGLLWTCDARAQSTLPPADDSGDTLTTPPRVLDMPNSSSALPSLPPSTPPLFAPPAGTLPQAPPLDAPILTPNGQVAGWFVDFDLGLIVPHIGSHVNSGSNLSDKFANPITLPIAPMHWVPSPFLRAGYRFANGAGDVRLDWRSVASQGTSWITDFDSAGSGVLHSQINVQYGSLTYGASEFLTNDPKVNRTWTARFGVAAADVFFDTNAHGQQILLQSASNSFAGVGPTIGFGFWKPVPEWHLTLYGELDATGLIGFTRQHFGESALVGRQTVSEFVSVGQQSNGVGILGAEGGISFAPWDERTWRFTLGYQWQRWWWVGATNDSNAALTLQGLFFRTEWRY
jgi:hypothetical protein